MINFSNNKFFKFFEKTFFVVLLCALLQNCGSSSDGDKVEYPYKDGMVLVHFALENKLSRSIFPDMPTVNDITIFQLYGTASTAPNHEENWLGTFEKGLNNASILLRPGTWNFTLYAFKNREDYNPILKGDKKNVVISQDYSGTVQFMLMLISDYDDHGYAHITIRLPSDITVDSVETIIDGEILDPPLVVNDDVIEYLNNEMTERDYYISFFLKDNNSKVIAVVSEILVIKNGQYSKKVFNLTKDDFNKPPAIPVDFKVTNYSGGILTFSWGNTYRNETGFILNDGTSDYLINAGLLSYDVPADNADGMKFTLKAINNFGDSGVAEYLAIKAGIPVGLSAEALSSSSIKISWQTVTNAVTYIIQRSASSTGPYIQVGNSSANTYTDNDVSPSTVYYYNVFARNIIGDSNTSNYVTSQTPAIPIPSNVSATVQSSNSISITWNATTEAKSYRIYRSTTATGTYTQIGTSDTVSYTDTGLTPSTIYYYKISTVTGKGSESGQSAYASAQTLAISVPSSVSATAQSPNSISITWNTITEAQSYRIYRSTTATGTYTQIGTSTTSSYSDNSLTPSTTYYYKVSTVTSSGAESGQSTYASAQTPAIPVPSNVSATSYSSSIIYVTWNNVSGATSYRIYRSSTATGTYTLAGTSASSGYYDEGLSPSTTYYYKVSTVTSTGTEGAQSVYVSAKTDAVPLLPPPSYYWALPVSGGIRVCWYSVSGAQGYTVYRSTSPNGTFTAIASNISANTYLDSISGSAKYYYTIATVNSQGVVGSTENLFVFVQGPGTLETLPYYSSDTQWALDSITATGNKNYRFQAPAGKNISILWADSKDGGNTFTPRLTGDIIVNAYYEDTGEIIFMGQDNGYLNGNGNSVCKFYCFTARYIIVEVEPYSANTIGTFYIKWKRD